MSKYPKKQRQNKDTAPYYPSAHRPPPAVPPAPATKIQSTATHINIHQHSVTTHRRLPLSTLTTPGSKKKPKNPQSKFSHPPNRYICITTQLKGPQSSPLSATWLLLLHDAVLAAAVEWFPAPAVPSSSPQDLMAGSSLLLFLFRLAAVALAIPVEAAADQQQEGGEEEQEEEEEAVHARAEEAIGYPSPSRSGTAAPSPLLRVEVATDVPETITDQIVAVAAVVVVAAPRPRRLALSPAWT